ncbi:TetR/AcrR family transcriptional regulator [Allokutzneria sp. A3M-2-11 16]|uniref:TetR/AcrR family transcriptional regulator n=1 Tax=Allokutzneria sp. A3M-2-11 16 TaxID=2962043 RepID=UPI0020B6D243|nr:WHG domain-containing protein [Allokutzneria sp. A3M-2-11 16]MCP3805165.1 TetR/AcrR family transcriptional regulator [Allokutzneria sp. A3M-2-11 16]
MTTSRRDRVRKATLDEIHDAARRLLTTKGPAAVTINAVGREVGISGPALYHYFSGHDELVNAMTVAFLDELTDELRTADGFLNTCRALRDWAVAHPAEFGWIFTRPVVAGAARYAAGMRFEQVIRDQVVALWREKPFPVPDLADLAPGLREQLVSYSEVIGGELPPAAVHVVLTCWSGLYGLVCMEVLHQLDFAYSDMAPVFEEHLRGLASRLGIAYSSAGSTPR